MKVIQWRTELQGLMQGPNETVASYAQKVKNLIRRIDYEDNWSEREKIFNFVKGLRRDIAGQTNPFLMVGN